MKRRILIGLLSIVALNTSVSLAAGATKNENKEKPNIIIVITDYQGYGYLASRGKENRVHPAYYVYIEKL